MENLSHFTSLLFSFFVYADYPLLWIRLLLITNSNPICILFMVPLCHQEIKFAAGPFILANHADIKSLKALRVAPVGALLNTSLRQDIVLQLCFHPLPPLVLSSCCFEPQYQTVMRHFITASPTPTRNCVLC